MLRVMMKSESTGLPSPRPSFTYEGSLTMVGEN